MSNTESDVQNRCSEACIRAGLAALLLAAVCFALGASLEKVAALRMLANYATLRFELKDSADRFFDSVDWRHFVELEGEAEADQLKVADLSSRMATHARRALTENDSARDPSVDGSVSVGTTLHVPNPPGAMVATIEPRYLADVLKSLHALCDERVIFAAGEFSNAMKRSTLGWYRHLWDAVTNALPNRWIGNAPAYLVTLPQGDLRALTFADIRFLANYQLPEAEFFDTAPRAYRFSLPWVPGEIEATQGVRIVNYLLCVISLYFWMYLTHAARAPQFAVAGTLFAVVRQTAVSRLAFIGISLVPVVSAGSLFLKERPASDSLVAWFVGAAFTVASIFTMVFTMRASGDQNEILKGSSTKPSPEPAPLPFDPPVI